MMATKNKRVSRPIHRSTYPELLCNLQQVAQSKALLEMKAFPDDHFQLDRDVRLSFNLQVRSELRSEMKSSPCP